MPPTKSQVNCPNCRQPVVVEAQQLFDLNEDPAAKQRLLAGGVNFVQCPHCGFQGPLTTPIVYHDPQKELLITYVPTEMGLPQTEQERLIGSLINRAINQLPQEKRKGYLLNPETVLTHQRLIERILEEDGITKEMIEAQQARMSLIQRLMNISEKGRAEVVQQEDELLDAQFFMLLAQLIDASQAAGDQEAGQRLKQLHDQILPLTSFGRVAQEQSKEIEAAIQSLQDAGDQLTQEKLLDLVVEAPNDTRVRVLVSLARPGMDYHFFQLLTDRIERLGGEEKVRLTQLREQLLDLTGSFDRQMEARAGHARELLATLAESYDIQDAIVRNLDKIDDIFVQVLNAELDSAKARGDMAKIDKYQRVAYALQVATTPPEVDFIQDLLGEPDTESRQSVLEARSEEVTPALLEALTALLAQVQSGDDPQLAEQLREIHRLVVRFSMKAKLDG